MNNDCTIARRFSNIEVVNKIAPSDFTKIPTDQVFTSFPKGTASANYTENTVKELFNGGVSEKPGRLFISCSSDSEKTTSDTKYFNYEVKIGSNVYTKSVNIIDSGRLAGIIDGSDDQALAKAYRSLAGYFEFPKGVKVSVKLWSSGPGTITNDYYVIAWVYM